jgi:large subunit ribosomal protein L24
MKEMALRLKTRIKKGDTVAALTGKDRGKTGKVLRIFPLKGTAIVEGIRFTKKSVRKTRQQDPQQGGIIHRESPIRLSSLAIFCKNCNKPSRVGVSLLSDGTKSRFCKRCKELV